MRRYKQTSIGEMIDDKNGQWVRFEEARPPELKENLWGIDDVCDYLNLDRDTVHRIIREEKHDFPCLRITQKIFKFEREEIYKWAESKKQT